MSLIPAGKITDLDGKIKKVFIIWRRLRLDSLVIIGETYKMERIPQTEAPFMTEISKVAISEDNKKMMVEYTSKKKSHLLKVFYKNLLGSFMIEEQERMQKINSKITHAGNFTLDCESNAFEAVIELTKSHKPSVELQRDDMIICIKVKIPDYLVENRDLVESKRLDRNIVSSCRRLIFTGRILIQLSPDLKSVE